MLISLEVTIQLPYVEGSLEQISPGTYDDSVDVVVRQSAKGLPCANLELNPAGPCTFTLLGFSTDGLRQLAQLLIRAASEIDEAVTRSKE